jgi:hypothetical protein
LESKKLPGIRLVPIEFKALRQTPTECAQPFQQIRSRGLARDPEHSAIGNGYLNFVTLLEAQYLHDRRRKPNGKAIPPPRNLHGFLLDIHPYLGISNARLNLEIVFLVIPELGSALLAENITVEDLESGLKAIAPSQT